MTTPNDLEQPTTTDDEPDWSPVYAADAAGRRECIAAFQTRVGLPADGVMGSATAEALAELGALVDGARCACGAGDPYRLLTRDEVAAHLRCTKQYVSALTNAGKLHAVRIGKRVLVPRSDLEAFIRGDPALVSDGHYPPTPSLFDGA